MKRRFLLGQAMVNSIAGAFQHAGVYRSGISEDDRRRPRVREVLSAKIRELAAGYSSAVSNAKHCSAILSLSEAMTREFADAQLLRGDRFSIGIVQKALNLYLKYLWCLDEIAEPPHCPIDRRVIALLAIPSKEKSRFDWTKLECIDAYRFLIGRCRETAGAISVAQWELDVWRFEPTKAAQPGATDNPDDAQRI